MMMMMMMILYSWSWKHTGGVGGLDKEDDDDDDIEIAHEAATAEEWYMLGKAYATGLGQYAKALRYYTYAQKTTSSSRVVGVVSQDDIAVALASSMFELGDVSSHSLT